MRILFVCTGNTCRSCMAEGFLKLYADKNNVDVKVRSAGLHVFRAEPPSDGALYAMMQYGIDISRHRSKCIDNVLVELSDTILTMTENQSTFIKARFPQAENKVYSIYDYTLHCKKDIIDPYGQSNEYYKKCAEEIKELVELIIKSITENQC